MDRDDGPTVLRSASGVIQLPGGQAPVRGVDRRDRSSVLLLGATSEVVDDAIGHGSPILPSAPRPQGLPEMLGRASDGTYARGHRASTDKRRLLQTTCRDRLGQDPEGNTG